MRMLSIPVALLAACSDDGLTVYNSPPTASIEYPVDGAEFAEGETIEFVGRVHDDSDVTELTVDWVDSVAGKLEEGTFVDAQGYVSYITSVLEPGSHTIVLRAYDAAAEVGSATVDLTIVDVPDSPSISILHPDLAGEELGLEDSPFVFMAEVSDYQDPPEDIEVELVASPSGLVCTMSPDGAGTAQCPATLPVGQYTLTFTATDTDGNTATANAPFWVVTRDDYDMDGDGYTPNGGDCNDSSDTIYPGAPEICDGLDNDCIDETAIDVGTDCYDDDGDGYCENPPCVNSSETLADCDDTDASRYPDPTVDEVVNGLDDDCNGLVDDTTVVYDDDGDGFCESPPCVNSSETESDCDDDDPWIAPDLDEICGDGFDNNCDGYDNDENAIGCTDFYYDGDGDTYGVSGPTECWCDAGSYPYTGLDTTDCYDSNASAYPGQTAYFSVDRGDGSYDYNCDGSQERLYQGTTGGCSWDFEPFSCEVDGEGWLGSEKACGASGAWVDDCSGEYDVICILLCGAAPATCASCWSCEADESTTTQSCR